MKKWEKCNIGMIVSELGLPDNDEDNAMHIILDFHEKRGEVVSHGKTYVELANNHTIYFATPENFKCMFKGMSLKYVLVDNDFNDDIKETIKEHLMPVASSLGGKLMLY